MENTEKALLVLDTCFYPDDGETSYTGKALTRSRKHA